MRGVARSCRLSRRRAIGNPSSHGDPDEIRALDSPRHSSHCRRSCLRRQFPADRADRDHANGNNADTSTDASTNASPGTNPSTSTNAGTSAGTNARAGSESIRDVDRHEHRDDRFQRPASAERYDVRVRAFEQ